MPLWLVLAAHAEPVGPRPAPPVVWAPAAAEEPDPSVLPERTPTDDEEQALRRERRKDAVVVTLGTLAGVVSVGFGFAFVAVVVGG